MQEELLAETPGTKTAKKAKADKKPPNPRAKPAPKQGIVQSNKFEN
jgi:hypothetical protein